MTRDFFLEQMNRLSTCYGERSFNDERIELFWKIFHNENEKAFLRAINNLIATSYVSPNAIIIRDKIKEFSFGGVGAKHEFTHDCSWCGTSGFVEAISADSQTKCAFKCKCEYSRFAKVGEMAPVFNWQDGFVPLFWSDEAKRDPEKIEIKIHTKEEAQALANKYTPAIMASINKFVKVRQDFNEQNG